MGKGKPRAAIYARISDARDGDTAGVDRQLEDCRKQCQEKGYDVVAELVDNNRSAFKPGGRRPKYDAMMQAVAADHLDVIVCYSADRLYRQLRDLETLADLLKRHGVRVDALMSGQVDLSTADGQMQAGLLAVVAKHESQKRGERVARAARQRSESGRFNGGVRRFGYNATMTELVPVEADAIRSAYESVAAGESVRSVWKRWTEQGLRGAAGGKIQPSQITTLLRKPHHAGLASYKGEVLAGKCQAPAIVDVELWQTVQAVLSDPARVTAPKGRPAKALMAGLMTCGVCGEKTYRHIRGNDRERNAYACHGNKCTTRSGRLVDEFVDAVLSEWLAANGERISRPVPRKRAPKTDPAVQAQSLRQKLDDLALLLAAGDLGAADYARATKEVRARLDALESQIVDEQGLPNVRRLADNRDVRKTWMELPTESKRAVISELLESGALKRITLEPVGAKRDGNPGVKFTWGKK
jgi:DNA invertase Pin-like site-specific DNA recombinase